MRRPIRTFAMFALAGVLASVIAIVPSGTASAAESIPTLRWPAISVGRLEGSLVASSNGDITTPCAWVDGGTNLKTYDSSGKLVRQLNRTSMIDGVSNCIDDPVVAKNGVLYGIPSGKIGPGPNLLAYSGNTLKWKYPVRCSHDQGSRVVVGANGNIYATTSGSGGLRLIGLTPGVASGKTQPTKVLDIKVDSNTDCSTMIYPYKDGLILHGQLSGKARYYSYSGKFLGQAAIGDIWSEKTSASGQLFVPSYTTGSFQSASVSMYDPRTGTVAWKSLASTPGSNVRNFSIVPLSSGGVLACVEEQEMALSGMPATPVKYVRTLVTLNSAGRKIKAVTLPNSDSSGNTVVATYLSAESNGNVVVTRELNVDTQMSWPKTVSAFTLGVYDPAAGTWKYRATMQGNLQKKGGPSGYSLDVATYDHAVTLANNTIYAVAHCSNNCSDSTQKLYPIKANGLEMDYPQGAVLKANTKAQPAPVSYVALGDSFSSGEGVKPFEEDSDTSTDKCHRSELAYAKLTSRNPNLAADLNRGGFYACSGSQTSDILSSQSANSVKNHVTTAQWKHLSASTKVVTVTIGGNDIEFSDFASACVWPPGSWCDSSTAVYTATVGNISSTLPGALKTTYEKILVAAPNAKVYVLDYPYVNGVKNTTDPLDARCSYLYNGKTPWANAQAARDIVTKVNAQISSTIRNVRAEKADHQRLRYVPTNGTNSPFAGHGVCDSGSSYFLNIDPAIVGNVAYVFHPNANGQAAYGQLIASAIAAG